MDSLKTYFVEVVLKKMGPAFVKGAVAWLVVYMGAHQGLLSSIGITYDGSHGHDLDIDLDVLSTWALTLGTGSIMALFTAAQHHTTAAIEGKPQDGSHERSTDIKPNLKEN